MKITHIETIPVRVPIRPQFIIQSSQGPHEVSPFLIVIVHTDVGDFGIGKSSCTPLWSGEDHFTGAQQIKEILSPALIGESPNDVNSLVSRMNILLPGNPFTKSAVQMALWDIVGKSAGLPLFKLFGGTVKSSITTKFSISGCPPERAADIAAWAVDIGFQTVKVKVGIGEDQDFERVKAVRQAVGPKVRIGVDANGGWDTNSAIRMTRRIRVLDIFFAEQPIRAGDLQAMALVRSSVGVPIIADESVFNLTDVFELSAAQAADVFSIYVGKGDGLIGARKMANTAEAAGLTCTVGSNLELGIGSAAMIHLAASTSGVDPEAFPCDIIGPFYYDAELLKQPLKLSGGQAKLPIGPGLGIELDMDAVRAFTVRQ